jgi:hypothetical protein
MHIDDDFAPVELFQHRLEERMPEPFVAVVGLQPNAVRLERVERVGDLLERGVDVQHGQRCEQTKTSREVADHLGAVVVADAYHASGGLRTAIEPEAGGRGERDDRRADPVFVHLGDRLVARPCDLLRRVGHLL